MLLGVLAKYTLAEDEFIRLGFCGYTWQWGIEIALTYA